MTYTKTTWVNGQAPAISATNLNNIENGIKDLETTLNSLTNTLFPIGKVEIFYDNNDHSNYLGFTWQKIATGKTLVGIDTNDNDFNTIGKTGGSKYLQQHNHTIIRMWNGTGFSTPYGEPVSGWGVNSEGTGSATWTTTQSTGTGNSGNLQPYEVVAIWKRIA